VRIEGAPPEDCEAVVFACPAYATASWLGDLDPALGALLRELRYASCATVSLVYREADLGRSPGSFGFFVPRTEGVPLLACSFASVKFQGRVPKGEILLRAFLGGAARPEVLELDDDALARLAHDQLAGLLAIRGRPLLSRTYRFQRVMPQFEVGWPGLLDAIRRRLELYPGLFLAGSAAGAFGLPDCIASGEQAARGALDHLVRAAADRSCAVR
jgi:oxygen-dependent protoporphyrinogen oxidase